MALINHNEKMQNAVKEAMKKLDEKKKKKLAKKAKKQQK